MPIQLTQPKNKLKKDLVTSKVINTSMIALAVVALFMQLVIDDSSDNIASACIALVGSLCTLCYLRFSDGFETHPISTFAVFGFCATSQLGALLVQSVMWQSIAQHLRQPIYTFSVLVGYQIVAICAHMTYRFFSSPNQSNFKGLSIRGSFNKLGVYDIPTAAQLWIIGIVGIVAIFNTGNNVTQSIGNKISVGMSFLAWAPFLIPIFVSQLGKSYCNAKSHYFFLVFFAIFIALIGIAANARYMIVSGVTTISFITLLIGMRSHRVVTTTQIVKVAVILGICAAMLIPVSQLATAMVVVRESHRSSSAMKTITATIDTFMRPELIEAQRRKDQLAVMISPYDEIYVENPVLTRFVLTKYHDNSLYFGSKLTSRGQDELADTTIDLFWSILPDPILKYFDIPVVKHQLKFSMGDYLYHQATGGALGGFKIGSIFGQGIGLFGWFFSIVYFATCLVSFWILDFLANRNRQGQVTISIVGILLIWRLYLYGITAESINNTIGFLFREIPQSILLFVVIYYLARFITRRFSLVSDVYSGKPVSKPMNISS